MKEKTQTKLVYKVAIKLFQMEIKKNRLALFKCGPFSGDFYRLGTIKGLPLTRRGATICTLGPGGFISPIIGRLSRPTARPKESQWANT